MTIAIMGLGYVGLPLAIRFAKAGETVIGLDTNSGKIQQLWRGESYLSTVSCVPTAESCCNIDWTWSPIRLQEADTILICVPTPLDANREPDLSAVRCAAELIGKFAKAGVLVILESTVWPGATREVVGKIIDDGLVARGIHGGVDASFFLAFSPEREDPGSGRDMSKVPKVIGADSVGTAGLAVELYSKIFDTVHVTGMREAEMSKLMENIYRAVNIALVNELKMVCQRMDIDVHEALKAAATKPFGFQAFQPGPGVGGHCLAGEEWLWVRTAPNSVRVMTCADAYAAIAGGTAMEAFAIDMQTGLPKFMPIKSVSKRMSDTPLCEVHLRDHRQLTVTDGHPMLVESGEEQLACRRADELVVGDRIPIVTAWPDEAAPETVLDLIDLVGERAGKVWVRPITGHWRDWDQAVRKACRSCKVAAKDVYSYNSMPLRVFLRLEAEGDAVPDRSSIRLVTGKGGAQRQLPAQIPVDEDFARLVGYYLSEGCITVDKKTTRTYFCFASYEQELIDDCCGILDKLGVAWSIYRSKRWRSVSIKVSSMQFGFLFRDALRCGTRSENVRIPDVIMGGSRAIRRSVLSGLLRGDGGVSGHPHEAVAYRRNGKDCTCRRNWISVSYFSSSPELLQQITMLLQSEKAIPQFRPNRPLLTMHGRQTEDLIPLFAGEKLKKLECYRDQHSKKATPRAYRRRENYASVEVASVTRVTPRPVYSFEVQDYHTFVTSYGIAVHNCIFPDPYYLAWKAREFEIPTRFVELAGEINMLMPRYVVARVQDVLNDAACRPLAGSDILVLGVAYKPDVNDTRSSPAERIIELLEERGADVSYYDMHATLPHGKEVCTLRYDEVDLVLVVTHHSDVDYAALQKTGALIVDTRGVVPDGPNVFRA